MFWRLHEAIFGERAAEARDLLETMGDTVQLVSGGPSGLPAAPCLSGDEPALALTTLQDARRSVPAGATPWLYFDRSRYDVSFWLPRIAHHIPTLNRQCLFLPAGMLLQADPRFLSRALHASKVFVRPDDGGKSFTGGVLSLDNSLSLQAKRLLEPVQNEPERLCLIAPVRELMSVEWRFWVVDRQVVCEAPYGWDGDVAWSPAPLAARAIAEAYAANPWQPDLCSVVDVVEQTDASFWLNEINAVSTSGIYQAPLDRLLPALRDLAYREYVGEIALEC